MKRRQWRICLQHAFGLPFSFLGTVCSWELPQLTCRYPKYIHIQYSGGLVEHLIHYLTRPTKQWIWIYSSPARRKKKEEEEERRKKKRPPEPQGDGTRRCDEMTPHIRRSVFPLQSLHFACPFPLCIFVDATHLLDNRKAIKTKQ